MATRSMLVSFVGYPNKAFNLVPDNGLANLAASLIRAGHETLIWDCSTVRMMKELYPYHERDELKRLSERIVARVSKHEEPAAEDLRAFYALEDRIDRYQEQKIRELGTRMAEYASREKLDFVGFKLWTGVGFTGSIILAQEIRKRNPSARIFAGGPHVDWFMHRSLQLTDAFDVLVYGEGEDVIVQLADYVEGKRLLRDVSNAIYLENGRPVTNPQIRVESVDSLALPVYDEPVYPAMRGDEKIKVVLLDESRGCPNNCHFCIHPIKSGRRRRAASAAGFVDRLQQLIAKHGFRYFRFAGSNPPAGLRRQIAAEILRRDMKVSFSGFAHVRGALSDDYGLLRRAGCKALAFGVESGSQRILDESMNKGVKVEDMRRALELCRSAGIAVVVTVIVPAPHETEDTKEETFRLLCDVRPDATTVSFPAVMHGTAWERERERFGFEIADIENLYKNVMTHRMNFLAPAILWRPLADYKLNGMDFQTLTKETAEFVQRLKKAGLTTQVFDHVILLSELAQMPPAEFAETVNRCMGDGDVDSMQDLVSAINRNLFSRSGIAAA